MRPTRPVLRYYGGKWRMAPWIISQFPVHTCYVEPFCGAASVFFRKPPAEFEVINDLDGEVVNFFEVLRDRTDEFIGAILGTPYSRAEYDTAAEIVVEPLERARRYYVRAWQGRGGVTGRSSGWRFQRRDNGGRGVVRCWNDVEHLYGIVWRLKQAFIENDDALEIIERYDRETTVFYVDPPYLQATRSRRWKSRGYMCEIDEEYHCRLLDQLQEIRGMAIISGYASALYEERLIGWRRLEKRVLTSNSAKVATEVLWVSPAAVAGGQMGLGLDQGEDWDMGGV